MTPPRREFRWKSRLYFRHKNVAVITTRFILSGQENITHVYHHLEDGIWEFVGEEDANDPIT